MEHYKIKPLFYERFHQFMLSINAALDQYDAVNHVMKLQLTVGIRYLSPTVTHHLNLEC